MAEPSSFRRSRWARAASILYGGAALGSLLVAVFATVLWVDSILLASCHGVWRTTTHDVIFRLDHGRLRITANQSFSSFAFYPNPTANIRRGPSTWPTKWWPAIEVQLPGPLLRASRWRIDVAMWFMVALALPLPIVWSACFVRGYQRHQKLAAGLCIGCGYDLRASKERCPECGLKMPASALAATRSRTENGASSRVG